MDPQLSVRSWQEPRTGLDTLASLFALDDEQRIRLWSQGMEQLLGVPSAKALGQPCYHVVSPRVVGHGGPCGPGCAVFRRLQQGHLKSRCHMLLDTGGGATWFEAEALALPRGAGTRALVLLHPQGEETSASLSSLIQDIAALGNLSCALGPGDLDVALSGVLTLAREATGAESAEVFLLEPLGQQMVLAGHQGPFRQAFEQITRFRLGEGFPGLAAVTAKPVVTTDLIADPRFLRTLVKEKGFRHFVCVPAAAGAGVLGCLNVASRRSEAGLSARLPLLSAMAGPLASTIYNWSALARERLGDPLPRPSLTPEENTLQLLREILHPLMEASRATTAGSVVRIGGKLLQTSVGDGVAELGPLETCPALSERVPLSGASCTGLPCALGRRQDRLCLPLLAGHEVLGLVWLLPDREVLASGVRLSLLSVISQRAATLLHHALVYQRVHEAALEAERQRLAQVNAAPGLASQSATQQRVLDIHCLGPFQVRRLGQPVPPAAFSRRQALTVLKLLVVHRGRPVSAEAIMEHLWPDTNPAAALNRLHGVIHALRQAVEPSASPPWRVVLTQADSYYLDTAACQVDVDGLLSGLQRGRAFEKLGRRPEALAAYRQAAGLYHGDFMEDEPYSEWCWEEREHLRETYMEVLRRMASLLAGQGDMGDSIHCLREALRVDPLREELHRELMGCLARAGRRDEALRQFHHCRRLLKTELDVAPLPQTERLYRQIQSNSPGP